MISAGDARRLEKGAEPIADGIDAALVVAAGIDIHEIGEQCDHRLMLPAEVLDDGGLRLDGHGCPPLRNMANNAGDHRQRPHPTQHRCRCE